MSPHLGATDKDAASRTIRAVRGFDGWDVRLRYGFGSPKVGGREERDLGHVSGILSLEVPRANLLLQGQALQLPSGGPAIGCMCGAFVRRADGRRKLRIRRRGGFAGFCIHRVRSARMLAGLRVDDSFKRWAKLSVPAD